MESLWRLAQQTQHIPHQVERPCYQHLHLHTWRRAFVRTQPLERAAKAGHDCAAAWHELRAQARQPSRRQWRRGKDVAAGCRRPANALPLPHRLHAQLPAEVGLHCWRRCAVAWEGGRCRCVAICMRLGLCREEAVDRLTGDKQPAYGCVAGCCLTVVKEACLYLWVCGCGCGRVCTYGRDCSCRTRRTLKISWSRPCMKVRVTWSDKHQHGEQRWFLMPVIPVALITLSLVACLPITLSLVACPSVLRLTHAAVLVSYSSSVAS